MNKDLHNSNSCHMVCTVHSKIGGIAGDKGEKNLTRDERKLLGQQILASQSSSNYIQLVIPSMRMNLIKIAPSISLSIP